MGAPLVLRFSSVVVKPPVVTLMDSVVVSIGSTHDDEAQEHLRAPKIHR